MASAELSRRVETVVAYSRRPHGFEGLAVSRILGQSNDPASPHQIDEADGMLGLDSAGPPATGLANQSHNHFIGVDQPTNLGSDSRERHLDILRLAKRQRALRLKLEGFDGSTW
jgi:hypothetical protein